MQPAKYRTVIGQDFQRLVPPPQAAPIPNYVTKALHKFQHIAPKRAQYAPHQWTRPNYGSTKQLATPLDNLPPIPEELNRRTQQIIGTLLYYALTADCTMIPSLNTLSEQQSSPTKNTEAAITHFLDYAATNPSAIIQYKSSDMILRIDSDAYTHQIQGHATALGCTITSDHYQPTQKISNPPATRKWPNPQGM